MPKLKKYPVELKERAVRLVLDARDETVGVESQLASLKTREANLLDLAEDGRLEREQIRDRMNGITTERAELNSQLESIADGFDDALEYLDAVLMLLENPYELYLRTDNELRRRMNQTICKYVFTSATDGVSDAELDDPLGGLLTAQDVMYARHYWLHDDRKITDVARRSWLKHHAGKPTSPASKSRGSFTQVLLTAKTSRSSSALVCNKDTLVGRSQNLSGRGSRAL